MTRIRVSNVGRNAVKQRKADWQEQLAIAKATIYQGLDAVDVKCCQAESRVNVNAQNAFIVGGGNPGGWQRCDRVPTIIAVEAAPDKLTKTRGAMSLCRSCAVECKKARPECLYLPAAPFKAAFAIGGHQAVKDMVYGAKPT